MEQRKLYLKLVDSGAPLSHFENQLGLTPSEAQSLFPLIPMFREYVKDAQEIIDLAKKQGENIGIDEKKILRSQIVDLQERLKKRMEELGG